MLLAHYVMFKKLLLPREPQKPRRVLPGAVAIAGWCVKRQEIADNWRPIECRPSMILALMAGRGVL